MLLPSVARWTSLFEKYVLSLMFLEIAYGKGTALVSLFERMQNGYRFSLGSADFAAVLLQVLTLLFGTFFGLTLLFNRKAVQDPQRWRDVVVPLMATFILYGFTALSPYAPDFLTRSLLPASVFRTTSVAAMILSLVGYAIALWSLAWLGRSLSLLVSVRTLVRGGPYRYVRHPMYLGYVFLVLGIAVASFSIFAIVLFVTWFALEVYRARLEEQTLVAFSDEYRRYAARTGFLLPGIGRLE